MSNKYYRKTKQVSVRKRIRLLGLGIFVLGLVSMLYFIFPVISWQIYYSQALAQQSITAPIPQTTILTKSLIAQLGLQGNTSLSGVDYTNAQNWFPGFSLQSTTPKVPRYAISIPKLEIDRADVSTIDTNLRTHLVNYGGTAIPPEKGNAVVFGHSTLPQLYNPKDYKTIFANLHSLRNNDTIIVHTEDKNYTYKIFSISIVEPEDTTVLTQTYDDSYLTLITCTPPGTVLMRLVIKTRLEQ